MSAPAGGVVSVGWPVLSVRLYFWVRAVWRTGENKGKHGSVNEDELAFHSQQEGNMVGGTAVMHVLFWCFCRWHLVLLCGVRCGNLRVFLSAETTKGLNMVCGKVHKHEQAV